MSQVKTGNQVHDAAVNKSEGVLQAATVNGAAQPAANTAAIAHYRTCLASALANNCGSEPFRSALRTLGVNS